MHLSEPPEAPSRLFVAVMAAAPVRAYALAAQASLRPALNWRWTPPEQLHITLKFLGDTSPEKTGLLRVRLQDIANGFSHIMVTVGEAEFFPTAHRVRGAWLGLEGGEIEMLGAWAEAVDRVAAEMGWPRETRPFRPHLTIGRARRARSVPMAMPAGLTGSPVSGPVWEMDHWCLVRSRLGRAGSRYEVLETWRLPARQERPASE